jgi:5-methylcytosine-specific restriction enzyme B
MRRRAKGANEVARAKWCGGDIYDAATAFKERCLVRDGSLFAPASGVWSPTHVRAVGERVGVEDLGSGSFIEKLEGQLDGLQPAEIQVGAELLYVLLLAEADTGGAKKREHISRILAMLSAEVVVPREVDAALDSGGVANFAAAKAYRDAGLRFLARLFIRLKDMPEHERKSILEAPWEFRSLVGDVRTSTDAMQAKRIPAPAVPRAVRVHGVGGTPPEADSDLPSRSGGRRCG